MRLKSHHSADWTTVFRKGNWESNAGIDAIGNGLLLNKWYHITYTLSDREKRMDIYINGVWTAFYAIENVQMHKVKFNDAPLHIGLLNGENGNFRYFNWRLSAEEVTKNYLKMKKTSINVSYEVISEPIMLKEKERKTVQHSKLPEVDDELSVSLRMRLKSHHSYWTTVFRKGSDDEVGLMRTPGLFLYANNSILHPRFTGNWESNAGIGAVGDGLLFNKWYHITYTLSDREKRMDIYINGVWTAFYAIENVQMHKVKFNDAPLHIGWFDGEIGNFRYFNWRLSAEEVAKNCLIGNIQTITHGFHEIISEPIMLEGKTVQHSELPEVDDELSVSLRIRLKSHHSGWTTVFRKGTSDENERPMRTPGLFLHANNSKLHPRFTGNWEGNAGIVAVGDGLLLNKWYHITYTLSDREKRMDIYINGVWTAFYAIENVQMHKVKFNDAPLHIGWFDGEIG
ncbi:hypothetical protein C1646_670573 [Rhizophagus diaphanus]|nr:hypothetical protein C1646_670573 [Rhizophagus diaphanus] [Rhizophagus sp. MUCL 43196]